MHLIGWLPEGIDDRIVSEKAAALGIKAAAISSFSLTKQKERGGLILGYTATGEKQIKQGVKKLAEALKDFA